MIVLGVTGSIGSGKSFASKILRRFSGVRSLSSDQSVHFLYNFDSHLIEFISRKYPQVMKDGAVDRGKLGDIVFNDEVARKELESIIYPKLAMMRSEFLKECIKTHTKIAVLEIPLLFENNLQFECDYVLTIFCNPIIQGERVMRRKGMTIEKFKSILNSQIPTSEKLKLTDFAINSGGSKASTVRELQKLYAILTA